jgi:hypothetical protein
VLGFLVHGNTFWRVGLRASRRHRFGRTEAGGEHRLGAEQAILVLVKDAEQGQEWPPPRRGPVAPKLLVEVTGR